MERKGICLETKDGLYNTYILIIPDVVCQHLYTTRICLSFSGVCQGQRISFTSFSTSVSLSGWGGVILKETCRIQHLDVLSMNPCTHFFLMLNKKSDSPFFKIWVSFFLLLNSIVANKSPKILHTDIILNIMPVVFLFVSELYAASRKLCY